MKLAHFFHVYCRGPWREVVAEHLGALADAAFDGPQFAGIVGDPPQRAQARELLSDFQVVAEAEGGFEQVTLDAIPAWAAGHPDDAVLYAHTKGVSEPSELNDAWRRSMTYRMVTRWHECLRALQDGYELCGCHWTEPEKWPLHKLDATTPYLGGNFWLARCDYILRLPAPGRTRKDAEFWIGLGNPRVLDLLPGWPDMDNLCIPR